MVHSLVDFMEVKPMEVPVELTESEENLLLPGQ